MERDTPSRLAPRKVGAPGERAIAINGGVGKQVRAAVASRFRVALVSRAHPDVLTPRCNAGNPAYEVAGSAVQVPIEAGFLLRSGNENAGNSGALDALTGVILPLKPPPHHPAEITADGHIRCH